MEEDEGGFGVSICLFRVVGWDRFVVAVKQLRTVERRSEARHLGWFLTRSIVE